MKTIQLKINNIEVLCTVENPERFRLEVEAKQRERDTSLVAYWPNHSIFYISDGKKEWIMYNSIGKYIATFKLKSWK